MHLDLDHAVALAGLAAAALDVEAEASRQVAARARLLGAGEQFADRREQAAVGRRVRARRAADRALADVDHAVDLLEAQNLLVRRRVTVAAIQQVRDRLIQGVVDQRRLARARHAGHAGHQADRDRRVDGLQVVAAGRDDRQHALRIRRGARGRQRDRALAGQVLPGQRRGLFLTSAGVPATTILPPCTPAPGPRSTT